MNLHSNNWIGIDLGTYNSSGAIKTKDGTIKIIKSINIATQNKISYISQHENCKEFPSFISFNKDGSINEIGINSKEKAYTEPEFVVWGIKRLLGKTYSELKESGELDRFPYRIRSDKTNGQCLIAIGEKSYTPVQLCTEIFKKIKHDAETQTNVKIDSIVVSIPAYFDPIRVTPIVEAARNAGFINIKTIPEPVAAALAYQIDITVKPIKILVFDLGAGTLDVTAGFLYRHPNQPGEFKFQVMKNTGDSKLGGIDMDDRLLQLILDKCKVTCNSKEDIALIRRIAENSKIRLSSELQIEDSFQHDGKNCLFTLNQFELKSSFEGNGLDRNLLEECRKQVMAALNEIDWDPNDIELLILIGGPTKLPCIHDVFKIIFYSNPLLLQQLNDFYSDREKVDRMTAVSVGAVMSVDQLVNDIVPHGHGFEDVEIGDEQITYKPNFLIPRDSAYPFKSKPYLIQWTILNGLFEFKILQHVPRSEIQHFGYEYRFVGILKFAVKNLHFCMVTIQMGYNANKELEVLIKNAFTSESVTYIGMNNYTCIGINYPLSVKKRPDIEKKNIIKIPPSPEILEKFIKWVQVIIGFIQKKKDNYPIAQMIISQILDEISMIIKKLDIKSEYEQIYSKMNSLIWNSSSKGLLTKKEFDELNIRLSEFESELFKIRIN